MSVVGLVLLALVIGWTIGAISGYEFAGWQTDRKEYDQGEEPK
jgi:ABC-type dipeptide/oligopeptide/nickel transport system permease subunit